MIRAPRWAAAVLWAGTGITAQAQGLSPAPRGAPSTDTTGQHIGGTSARTMALGLVSASVWTQAIGVPEKWPRTWRGYGYRLSDQVGFALTEKGIQAGLSSVMPWRSEVRPCDAARGGRPVFARTAAAVRCGLQRTFVAADARGARRPNAPLLGAIVAASVVSLAWRPERESARKGQLFVLTRAGLSTGASVVAGSVRAWQGR